MSAESVCLHRSLCSRSIYFHFHFRCLVSDFIVFSWKWSSVTIWNTYSKCNESLLITIVICKSLLFHLFNDRNKQEFETNRNETKLKESYRIPYSIRHVIELLVGKNQFLTNTLISTRFGSNCILEILISGDILPIFRFPFSENGVIDFLQTGACSVRSVFFFPLSYNL